MSEINDTYNVEPLRTVEEIKNMKNAIRRGNKKRPKRSSLAERDVLIFLIGINTGLRVNDLVRLKVKDVRDKEILTIREGKTKRPRKINICMLKNELITHTKKKT